MLDLLFCLNYYWNRPIDFQVSIAHFLLNIELSYRCFVYNEGRVISDMYSLKSALNSVFKLSYGDEFKPQFNLDVNCIQVIHSESSVGNSKVQSAARACHA